MNRVEKQFNFLLKSVKEDQNILAFWLDGSRGKGQITELSDYDCTMIVKERAANEYKKDIKSMVGQKSNVK